MKFNKYNCRKSHVKEYRNYLVLLIHVFSSEQRSKAFIFVVLARFVVLFHVCAALEGRRLSHSYNAERADSSAAIVAS